MTFDDFRAIVLDSFRSTSERNAADFETIGRTDDLFGSGMVDSHMFIELCLHIEAKTGKAIDIAELDPEQFSTMDGLYGLVAA